MGRPTGGSAVAGALLFLCACGGGTAVVAGSGGGSSGGASKPVLAGIAVARAENPPADILLTLTRPGSVKRLTLEVVTPAETGPGRVVPIAELGASELLALETDATTGALVYPWAFDAPEALGTDEVTSGLELWARLGNGQERSVAPVSVGNSAPIVAPFTFGAEEVVGVVGMLFTVSDTTDTVTLDVEVFVEGAWHPALPDLGQELQPFTAVPPGTTVPFHWDVVGQFGPLDAEVPVRATATDSPEPGFAPLVDVVESSAPLLVDNNAPPVVTLDDASFLVSDDRRRGIVAPYTVSDAEGDAVQLVFQWTRQGEPFPELPEDEDALAAVLADPEARREHRIASRFPLPVGGRIVPRGPTEVELPELGAQQIHLLASAEQPGDPSDSLDGWTLELLRPRRPRPVAADWSTNPLDDPVAALAGPDGTTALVLDRAGADGFRLHELDLASGAVVGVVVAGDGLPDVLARERGSASVLVATHDARGWQVSRVDLASGAVTLLADVDRAVGGDRVRSVLSLGAGALLVTADDALLRLDVSAPPSTEPTTVVDGLATPWGLVADPVREGSVFLAERDAPGGGRVVSVDTRSRLVRALPTTGLLRPTALDLDRRTGRLLVLVETIPGGGERELRSVDLGGTTGHLLVDGLPSTTSHVSAGPDGLQLIALGPADDLAVGGGVRQRRAIVDWDRSRRVVEVDPAFDPAPAPARRWRLVPSDTLGLAPGSQEFVWDSGDLPAGLGRALLRITARDADTTTVQHDGGKPVLSGLQAPSFVLGAVSSFQAEVTDVDADGFPDLLAVDFVKNQLRAFFQEAPGVFTDPLEIPLTPPLGGLHAADLDGDGLVDLVVPAGGSIRVLRQSTPRVFDTVETLGGPGVTDVPFSPVAADLVGDERPELVTANLTSDTLTVFSQRAGAFDPVPLVLGGTATTPNPRSVVAADLDGDGGVDLACANLSGDTIALFYGDGADGFEPAQILGGPGITERPLDLEAVDLDGDGDLDLAVAVDGAVALLTQTAPRVFVPVPAGLVSPAGITPSTVDAVDVDGDGRPDLAVSGSTAGAGGDTLTLFFQVAPGVFEPSIWEDPGGRGPYTLADVDGDGRLDILSSQGELGAAGLEVWLRTGAGVFEPASPLLLDSSGPASVFGQPSAVDAVDVDGDGAPDLVAANRSGDTFTVFSQTAPGVFDPIPLVVADGTTVAGASSVTAVDLDGDGDTDLVTGNSVEDSLTVFLQEAPGEFVAAPPLGGPGTTDRPLDVVVGDVDGDGLLDVVSANTDGDTLTVFHQTGPGRFAAPLVLGGPGVTDGPTSVVVGDIDADGVTDIAACCQAGDVLTVLFQDAPGRFEAIAIGGAPTLDAPRAVVVADVDDDGLLDLASVNGGNEDVTVFFQRAPRDFDPVPVRVGDPSTLALPRTLALGDLDDDGEQDLVVGTISDLSDPVVVFRQDGPRTFDATPTVLSDFPNTSQATEVLVQDVDLDGDPDVVAVFQLSGTIAVWFNTHRP